MNAYAELGVEKDCSQEEIKAAYKKASLEKHPDKGGSSEEFTRMKKAYDFIKDPKKRKFYDEYGDLEVERNVESLMERILKDLFQINNPDVLKSPYAHLKEVHLKFVVGEKALEKTLKELESDIKNLDADPIPHENILRRLKEIRIERAKQLYGVAQEREICEILVKEFKSIEKTLGRSLSEDEFRQTLFMRSI